MKGRSLIVILRIARLEKLLARVPSAEYAVELGDAYLLDGRARAADEAYNVGAGHEVPNIESARRIIELTGADPASLKSVADRPGHDRRYALDCS